MLSLAMRQAQQRFNLAHANEGTPMEVSLQEAIEIHARVLRSWHRDAASEKARDHAVLLRRNGDHDGHDVWLRVAEVAGQLKIDAESGLH